MSTPTPQHTLPDPTHALPTNTLVDETQSLANSGTTGLGGSAVQTVGNTSASFTPKVASTGGEEDLKESARRQVEAAQRAAAPSGTTSSLTGSSHSTGAPIASSALPTNSLVDDTARLASQGSSGLGGSSVQTVGNTSASFTPKTASDLNTSAHSVAPVDGGPAVVLEGVGGKKGPLLGDQVPQGVKDTAEQVKNAVVGQVETARQGLDRAFNGSEAITPGNELPGGWGPTPQASTTGPNASTTTIYQDISTALNTVGQVAYNAIPTSLVDKLHSPGGASAASSPIKTTTNTVPHQTADHPTTLEDIQATLKEGFDAASAGVKEAADKAVGLGKDAYNSIPSGPVVAPSHGSTSGAPSTTKAGLSTNALPAPEQIIPSANEATNNRSLASSELPTLDTLKAEVSHAVDEVKQLFGYGAPQAANTDAHGVKAVDAGPKVDLLSSAHEIAPVQSGQSTASATRGEVTPSQLANSSLVGGGGLAATISDDVADAARHSTATSVGDRAPGARESALAGAGGMAAFIAEDVAASARQHGLHHHVSSSSHTAAPNAGGAAHGGLAGTISEEVARVAKDSHATAVNKGANDLSHPSVTGTQSALAGGGGLAATIADNVAHAAQQSSATSVGATGANAVPVASEHGHGGAQGPLDLNLGKPVFAGAETTALGAAGVEGSKDLAIPEPRETSHAPAVTHPDAIPTSSTAPSSTLAAGANKAPQRPGPPESISSTAAVVGTPRPDSGIESSGPHGLIQTENGLKHRHELTTDELAKYTTGASGVGGASQAYEKGSSAPPHDDINTFVGHQAGSQASPSSKSTTSSSSHKKKQSLSEKLKEKLHIGGH